MLFETSLKQSILIMCSRLCYDFKSCFSFLCKHFKWDRKASFKNCHSCLSVNWLFFWDPVMRPWKQILQTRQNSYTGVASKCKQPAIGKSLGTLSSYCFFAFCESTPQRKKKWRNSQRYREYTIVTYLSSMGLSEMMSSTV